MGWPAHWDLPDGEATNGTVYVPRHRLPDSIHYHHATGRAWRFGDHYTSYAPTQKLVYKSFHSFGRHPKSDHMQLVLNECQRAGLDPPSSYSDIFQQLSPVPWPYRSVVNPFRHFRIDGGWQAAFHHGRIDQPLYYYDMRSAYRWASTLSLPDCRSAMRYHGFSRTTRPGFALVKLKPYTLPYAPRGGWHFLTTEERDFFGIMPEQVHYMMIFPRTISLDETWVHIDQHFPASAKRISQHYWGAWACRKSVVQECFKSHSHREMSNRGYNPILAHFIVSRVKMRLVEQMAALGSRNVHMVFVDAILTSEPMTEGERYGDFKMKYCLERGGLILGPGVWGHSSGELIKHAGTPAWRLDFPSRSVLEYRAATHQPLAS